MKGQNRSGQKSEHANGHRRSNSRYNNNNNGSPNTNGNTHNEKLVFLITKSVGQKVIATVTSGARYQGVLVSSNISPQEFSSLSVILQKPSIVSKPLINEKSNSDKENELPEKLVIEGKDLIDIELVNINLNKPQAPPKPEQSKFKTDADISSRFQINERELQKWVPEDDSLAVSLDEDTSNSNEQWDQFKVNEEKFGVESTYDEHLYTTRINTSAPDYQERLAAAERLAREIEGQSSTDRHILEERGIIVDDSGIDEEDKYSGVDRRGDELMAALKNASISNDPSKQASYTPGKYVPPKHRAAQYHDDPAIISSSATKRQPPVQSTPAKPPSTSSTLSSKPDSIPPKPQVANQHNESFRLNAQSEINSLREFSANFKIPHKMPSDLLPILAKDKLKQDEILKKQEQQKKKDEEAQKNIQSPEATPQLKEKKMDPSKPAFKPNPKVAAFTPSQKHNQISPNPPKANYHRSPNGPSPRINNQRPYGSVSGSSSSGNSSMSNKRHYQISPADFFGGQDKIPTSEGQEEKTKKFRAFFNVFVTAQNKAQDKSSPLVLEKAFHTPPTWSSTVDVTHDKLFPPIQNKGPNVIMGGNGPLPFIPSPLLAAPSHPGAGAPVPNTGYAGGGKMPMSPHQQQQAAAMAHFQQQQFYAAMMYQQQQMGGAIPPGQPPMSMYPGAEGGFLPPGGFMMPPQGGFIGNGSPINANVMLGGMSGSPYGDANNGHHNNYNNHHHHGGRRYNNHQGKRGSNNG